MRAVKPQPSPAPQSRSAVWDIVRVAFPYADTTTTRHRPALVIARPDVFGDFALVWLLMITSARHAPWPFDVLVSNLEGTGLSHASRVRPAKIAALDARLVEPIGRLGRADRDQVRASIRCLLDGFL